MARSATDVIGNAVATAAVSRWEGQLREEGAIGVELDTALDPSLPQRPIALPADPPVMER